MPGKLRNGRERRRLGRLSAGGCVGEFASYGAQGPDQGAAPAILLADQIAAQGLFAHLPGKRAVGDARVRRALRGEEDADPQAQGDGFADGLAALQLQGLAHLDVGGAQGLLGEGAKTVDAVGIEFPGGKTLGNAKSVKMRFDATYMKMAADGAL